jgi:hypothetical protein
MGDRMSACVMCILLELQSCIAAAVTCDSCQQQPTSGGVLFL